ncbi:MAG: hypothetical protein IVW56_11380 [Candidatus Binataceae bacterium]|nr:hypothetical protein [Candidatus Binataceae bacterium]
MPETVAAINILIFLLPGFVSQKMVEWLTAHGRSGEMEMVRDALIFSLFNYLFYAILAFAGHHLSFTWSPFPPLPAVPLILSNDGVLPMHAQQVEALATLVIISIISGCVIAKALETGWLFMVFRRFRLTKKNSELDVWYDVFNDFRRNWLRVCFKDGSKIIEWPYYFSDDPDKRELFLGDALIQEASGEYGALDGPGVLIENMAEVVRIEVINGEREKDSTRETRRKADDSETAP